MNGTFIDVLRHIAQGFALDQLTEEQDKLIAEVRDSQQVGELTLVVRYLPRAASQVRVSYDIKVKRPKWEREDSLFFVADDGNLQLDNPRQGKLDIDPDAPRRAQDEDAEVAVQ